MRKLCFGLLGVCTAVALPSTAQAIDWTLGLGAGVAPDYEGSDDYQAVPLWNVRADDLYGKPTYAQLIANRFRSNLLVDQNWRLGIAAQYVNKRDDVDNDAVDSMRSTDDGKMLGLLMGYNFNLEANRVVGVEFEPRWDVSDNVGGLFTGRVFYAAPFGGGSWVFKGTAEVTYASEDYMSEYFGVTNADSARSGLNTYNADADFKDVAFGATLTYKFTESWNLTGLATYTRLVGDAADSPVVDDEGNDNQFFGGLLVNYKF